MDLTTLTPEMLEKKRFNRIFVIEMMERFGFYAFNVIIVMFFIYQFHLPEAEAASLFGAFSALLYVFIPIGGWIGDSYLGTQKTIVLGGITLLIGYLVLSSSLSVDMVYLGMGIIIVGNGLFKSNPASLLSKIFDKNDSGKRDAAYSMYYMAINFGSFISEVLSPGIAHRYGWQWGFALAAFGLIIGLLNFIMGMKYFKTLPSQNDDKTKSPIRLLITIVGSIILIVLCAILLKDVALTRIMMFAIVAIAFSIFLLLGLVQPTGVRCRMVSALALTIMAVFFYTLYQQIFLSMTFFGMNFTHANILGIPIQPEQYQIVNPFVIILGAPILSFLYKRAGAKGTNARITTKFTLGLFISSLAFLIIVPAQYFAHQGIVSSNWIVASFFFISIGELLVSALGLSMMSQLVPEKYMGFATGVWFLALAISGVTGALVSNMTSPHNVASLTVAQSLPIYCHAYLIIGSLTLAATLLMFIVKLITDRYLYPKK